jgi:hypothetical protein
MATKVQIYNLALSALLLTKEIEEIDTDTSNEVRILNLHWNLAFESTMQDLNLNSIKSKIPLELIEELDDTYNWTYAYRYPSNCIFLKRLVSCARVDSIRTAIDKEIGEYEGEKAVFTDEVEAVAECITNNFPITMLNPMAALAVAYKLAMLSAPLITGKGARALKESLKLDYVMAKSDAQETDHYENQNFEHESVRSEFVAARME